MRFLKEWHILKTLDQCALRACWLVDMRHFWPLWPGIDICALTEDSCMPAFSSQIIDNYGHLTCNGEMSRDFEFSQTWSEYCLSHIPAIWLLRSNWSCLILMFLSVGWWHMYIQHIVLLRINWDAICKPPKMMSGISQTPNQYKLPSLPIL